MVFRLVLQASRPTKTATAPLDWQTTTHIYDFASKTIWIFDRPKRYQIREDTRSHGLTRAAKAVGRAYFANVYFSTNIHGVVKITIAF